LMILERQHVLGGLAHGVGAKRPQGGVLSDGQLIRPHQSLGFGRGGDLDGHLDLQIAHPLQQMKLSEHSGRQGLLGRLPGGVHEGLGSG
jgi:hypothetical protein